MNSISKKHIYYDKENDILAVHNGFFADEKFKGNIDAGNIILDVSTKGRVRGIEILHASEFFKEFNAEGHALEEMTDADVTAAATPAGIMVGITLKTKRWSIPAKIAVAVGSSSVGIAR